MLGTDLVPFEHLSVSSIVIRFIPTITSTTLVYQSTMSKYQPPPGPPPGYSSHPLDENPPPYHNWQEAVPDTATFPPPPISGFYSSGAGNASSDDAERAHHFCDHIPLWTPVRPSAAVCNTVENDDLHPVRPREFNGELVRIGKGRWRGFAGHGSGDSVILSHLPLYFAAANSPLVTEKSKTIYFEVKVLGLGVGPGGGGDSSGLAVGFVAQPYPTWRSPGWERGSLGVFSDDGCRFVNDSWGGRDFIRPFEIGDTIGLGMVFSLPENINAVSGGTKPTVTVFCTRNGQREGGWDLHEEVDEESGSVTGLEGDFDLYGAVGLFGGVGFEVCFDHTRWLYRPSA